ncbi:hypothetical protein [Duganella aceris]|uniref:DUF4760 domain-containing protein n=1 Tax=Duganella aceris TaxID=2703883 RepID=A0ABX0FGV7_9BURK|nr:hypothetical protein [Duganella aceris]NGZ83815.1 hypothetical protein [Duganella aceris]
MENKLEQGKIFMEYAVQVSTIAVPFIAFIALIVAIWQIKAGRNAAQRAAAYTIYQAYLKLAMDNPMFSSPDKEKIMSNKEILSRYKWYVSNMLLSFEEILLISHRQTDWKTALESQLKTHAWYLVNSSSVRRGDWKPGLRLLIAEVLEREVGRRDLARISRQEFLKYINGAN